MKEDSEACIPVIMIMIIFILCMALYPGLDKAETFADIFIEQNIDMYQYTNDDSLLCYLWKSGAFHLFDKIVDQNYKKGKITYLHEEIYLDNIDMLKFYENDYRIKINYYKLANSYFLNTKSFEDDKKINYLIDHLDNKQIDDVLILSILSCPHAVELIIDKKPHLLNFENIKFTGFFSELLKHKKSFNILKNHFGFENILDNFIENNKEYIFFEHMIESLNDLDKDKIIKLCIILLEQEIWNF